MTRLAFHLGDITTFECDAIVNAANASLLGGGGVDGAIHRAGGPAILQACREIRARSGPLETGGAVATTAGELPARWVIHTVGPVWGSVSDADAERLLADCYRNSLEVAASLGARSIAFPNISTGVYRFPKPRAAQTAVDAVRNCEWLEGLDLVTFVCFDEVNRLLYEALLG